MREAKEESENKLEVDQDAKDENEQQPESKESSVHAERLKKLEEIRKKRDSLRHVKKDNNKKTRKMKLQILRRGEFK